MWDPYAEFERIVLPNGLTIYAAQWNRSWQNVNFVVHSGAENDPVGLEGEAHFVEHLVSENADETMRKMQNFFKGCGGEIDFGGTDWSSVGYQFLVPMETKVMTRALSLFGSMLVTASMEKHIERERRVIINEFKRDYPTPMKFDMEMREQHAVFAGLWPERMASQLGSLDSIRAITQGNLGDYYDNHYTPANMSVVTVGGFKPADIAEILSESPFGKKKKGQRTPIPDRLSLFEKLAEHQHIYSIPAEIPQEERLLSGRFRTVAKIPGSMRMQAVDILATMLDKALYEAVREDRSWTYKIEALWDDFRMCYRFPIDCEAIHSQAVNEIGDVVKGCIDSIGENGLFEEVYQEKMKEALMLDLSGKDLCNEAVEEVGLYQKITTRREHYRVLESVTKDEVLGLLEHLQPENRWTLLVQP